MSTYSEFCGIVHLKPGLAGEAVAAVIREAIGQEDQELFFPIGDVIEVSDPGWQCQQCGTKVAGSELELATARCQCGTGAGRWEAHAAQEAVSIDFGSIPPEGAHNEVVERAMLALAPFVDTSEDGFVEIEMVPGMNWGDAAMYRFIAANDGFVYVEVSNAVLRSDGDWHPVKPDPPTKVIPRSKTTIRTEISTQVEGGHDV